MLQQRPFCFYCKRTLNDRRTQRRNDRNKGLDFTKDHMTPLARGGPDIRQNRVPCCYRCNNLKGDLTAPEFFAYIRRFGFEQQPYWIKAKMKCESVPR
jgi:5-methylcytosine-specific restriction endonuclease McrA